MFRIILVLVSLSCIIIGYVRESSIRIIKEAPSRVSIGVGCLDSRVNVVSLGSDHLRIKGSFELRIGGEGTAPEVLCEI